MQNENTMVPIKEITFERVYDAPIELVWEAWTDPAMIKEWWGPSGVSIPECEIELEIGGKIYIVMEAGEEMGPYKGTRWPMLGQFTAVEEKSHFAYSVKAWTEGMETETQIDQVTEVSLHAQPDGKTKVIVKAAINKTGPAAGMAVQGMEHGFNQELDKLAVFLAKNK
jgi:uncharacterized protein YndB with AHSA1/START domain